MPKLSSKGLAERLTVEKPMAFDDHPLDMFAGDSQNLVNIPLSAITPNPDQPRKHFDKQKLKELAESIRSKGVLQPIIVKRIDLERFLLVAGERRYRASQLAKLEKIPALITTDDEQEIALIENLQREDLKPLEEAEGLKVLAERSGYTHVQLAAVIGKSRVTVTELLSLNDLPEQIKEECRATDIATKTHLLQVLREKSEPKQLALWDSIKTGDFSTKRIRRERDDSAPKPKPLQKKFEVEDPPALVTVRFQKSRATNEEILRALTEAAKEQRKLVAKKKR
jgi:ParB family transcriptional regulator, chromosome partitioning protein